MTDTISSDSSMRAARIALDGLAKQSEMIGNNIANVDTPGYRAQTVDFKTALQRAMNGSGGIQMTTTNAAHLLSTERPDQAPVLLREGGSSRADGNNVDMDVELTQMGETVLEYQTLSTLLTKKFSLLKSISQAAR